MLRFLAASCLARNPDLNFEISSNQRIKNGVGIIEIEIGIAIERN
jgi:hypothetical protein